jgi:hypothetical protein
MYGTGDTGTATGTGYFDIDGNNNTVTEANGAFVGLWAGTGNTLDVSGGSINAAANIGATVVGSNEVLTGGTADLLTFTGTADTATVSDSTVAVNAGDALKLYGSQNQVTDATGSNVVLYGTGDIGTATGTGYFDISGNNKPVTEANGSFVAIWVGTSNPVHDSDGTTGSAGRIGLSLLPSGPIPTRGHCRTQGESGGRLRSLRPHCVGIAPALTVRASGVRSLPRCARASAPALRMCPRPGRSRARRISSGHAGQTFDVSIRRSVSLLPKQMSRGHVSLGLLQTHRPYSSIGLSRAGSAAATSSTRAPHASRNAAIASSVRASRVASSAAPRGTNRIVS